MKIFKNLFGSKPKQTTKHEPNTLAEMNGSPDLRLATAKEKEVDIPSPKENGAKKTSKSSSKTSAAKSMQTAKKPAETKKKPITDTAKAEDKSKGTDEKKPSNKSSSTTIVNKENADKKNSSASNSSTKESTVKKVTKKESEIKKTSTPAKKVEQKAKAANEQNVKKPAKQTAAAPAVEAKKVAKPANKTEKKATSTENKTAAPTAKSKTSADKSSSTAKKASPAVQKSSTSVKKTAATSAKEAKAAKPTTKKEVDQKDIDIVTESKATRSGKFEIKKSKDGRFVFNLYASNNMIVATSQVYSSSTSAMNGIKSVIANASSAPIEDQSLKKVTPVPFPKWEIYLDKGEQYRFRLCASNGSCVCHSQGYTSKANCKKGIESIIKFASDAEITKVYLDKKEK